MQRSKVPYPAIPAAKHHVVDLPPMQFAGPPENETLVRWLDERVRAMNTATIGGLVGAAIYQGFADRIKRGDFDVEH